MPRPKRHRRLQMPPLGYGFRPLRQNWENQNVQLFFEEYESIRLADYIELTQEDAAVEMNISRSTFTRIYDKARAKIAKALVENSTLNVSGGHVIFEHEWYRCLTCDTTFRETTQNKGGFCPVCNSTKIEHINGTLHEAANITTPRNSMGDYGYCVCPSCNQKLKHQAGIPCKSIVCENCQVHYVRENSAHHSNINKIKKQQKNNNMKIAVTSIENNKDSKMDPRFGRGAFFAVYDTETKTFSFYENEAKNADGGAGPKAAEQVVNLGVKKLLSSDFGPKAKAALESMGIEMVLYSDELKTVEEILKENI